MLSLNFRKWFLKKKIIHNSKKRKKLLPSHFVLTSGLLVSEDLTLTRVVYPTFGSILDLQGPSCTTSSLPQPQNKIKQPQKGEKNSLNTLWISSITNLRIFSKTIFFWLKCNKRWLHFGVRFSGLESQHLTLALEWFLHLSEALLFYYKKDE